MESRDTRREQNQLTFRRGNEVLRDVVGFLMIAGHQRSEGERVVDTLSEYEVAPKTRLTGRCAKRRCTRLRGHSERVTGSDRPAAFAVLAA